MLALVATPGPSCGVCSSATEVARTRRSSGREVARCAPRRDPPRGCRDGATAQPQAPLRSSPQSRAPGALCRAGRSPDGSRRHGRHSVSSRPTQPQRREPVHSSSFASTGEASCQETDLALHVVALTALGDTPTISSPDYASIARAPVDATIWTVLALRAAGQPPPAAFLTALLAAQPKGGGSSWSRGGRPDSNDTAAAIQALRASGAAASPIRRAAAFLRTFQNPDGGFALTKGRESDAQSTAWAIQGLLAAGQRPARRRSAMSPGSVATTAATATRLGPGRLRLGDHAGTPRARRTNVPDRLRRAGQRSLYHRPATHSMEPR